MAGKHRAPDKGNNEPEKKSDHKAKHSETTESDVPPRGENITVDNAQTKRYPWNKD